MSATRDGKMWRCQFYYKDWQGVSRKKNKRGFKTKAEAEQWERDFLQQQQRNLDINFENFVQIYYEDMEHRLRENTMRTKKFIIDLKIIPYFKKKNMNEQALSKGYPFFEKDCTILRESRSCRNVKAVYWVPRSEWNISP